MLHNYIAFGNLCMKFQTIFQKIQREEYAKNAGNHIYEAIDFKIFQGRIPPDPPLA